MIVRPAEARDGDALWDLFYGVACSGETYAQDESVQREDFGPYWFGRGGEQWVAERDGRVVGAYTVRANHPGRGSHVATASYLVDPAARGGGVGYRLGEHSIERARAMGFLAMQFNLVIATNEPAVHLWKKLGFRVLATLPGVYRHVRLGFVDAYVMFREL